MTQCCIEIPIAWLGWGFVPPRSLFFCLSYCLAAIRWCLASLLLMHLLSLWGRFRTEHAQRGHSANYYGDYPGNNPENHAPAESCTINSKLKNSNI